MAYCRASEALRVKSRLLADRKEQLTETKKSLTELLLLSLRPDEWMEVHDGENLMYLKVTMVPPRPKPFKEISEVLELADGVGAVVQSVLPPDVVDAVLRYFKRKISVRVQGQPTPKLRISRKKPQVKGKPLNLRQLLMGGGEEERSGEEKESGAIIATSTSTTPPPLVQSSEKPRSKKNSPKVSFEQSVAKSETKEHRLVPTTHLEPLPLPDDSSSSHLIGSSVPLDVVDAALSSTVAIPPSTLPPSSSSLPTPLPSSLPTPLPPPPPPSLSSSSSLVPSTTTPSAILTSKFGDVRRLANEYASTLKRAREHRRELRPLAVAQHKAETLVVDTVAEPVSIRMQRAEGKRLKSSKVSFSDGTAPEPAEIDDAVDMHVIVHDKRQSARNSIGIKLILAAAKEAALHLCAAPRDSFEEQFKHAMIVALNVLVEEDRVKVTKCAKIVRLG